MKTKKKNLFPLFLFLIGVALRFGLGNYFKELCIYWDELKYYGIAHSLFSGQGISVRNAPTDFQKILYSLFLLPFFSVGDKALRMRLITLMNALLMNSSVFPLWGICRELGMEEKRQKWVCALLILWPDLVLSETFMSENLYWPLLFVFVWFLFRKDSLAPLLKGALLGGLIYLGFLCKELFAAALGALLLMMLTEWKFCTGDAEERRPELTEFLAAAVSFGLLFLLGKLSFFRGMGSSYHQSSLSALFTDANILYVVYFTFYLLVSALLSVLMLPVMLPLLRLKSMERKQQRYTLFLLFLILLILVGTAYSVSIREDSGSLIPRVHLRYVAPVVFLLLPALCVAPAPEGEEQKKNELLCLLLAAFLTVLFFRGAEVTDFDQATLQWVSLLYAALTKQVSDTLLTLLMRLCAALALGAALLVYTLCGKKGRELCTSFFVLLLLPIVVSNAVGHRCIKADYSADAAEWESVEALSERFSEEGNVLMLGYSLMDCRNQPAFDTCYDPIDRIYFLHLFRTTTKQYLGTLEGEYAVSELTLNDQVNEELFTTTDHIDYIVIPKEAKLRFTEEADVTPMPELDSDYFTVYKNNDPEKLTLFYTLEN